MRSEVTFGLGRLIAKPEFFLNVCTLGLFDLGSEYLCGSRCGPQEVQALSPEKAAGHQPPFYRCVAPWFLLQHSRGKVAFLPSCLPNRRPSGEALRASGSLVQYRAST